jgi:hypothetical protein
MDFPLRLNAVPSLRLLRTVFACAALAATAALAHDDHGKPQHGGVVAEASTFQVELVAGPKGPVLYVTDHGKPLSTAGASGKLVVLAAGQKSELALAPAGGNRLAPPQHPQTNGMVERFNGLIEEVLQSHLFHSGEELQTTLLR